MNEAKPEEAARWFLRLEETAAGAETFVAWQRWLSAAPENKKAFAEIEEVLMVLDRADLTGSLPSAAQMMADTYTGSVPVRDFLSHDRTMRKAETLVTARPEPSLLRKQMPPRFMMSKLGYAIAAGLTVVLVTVGLLSLGAFHDWRQGHFAYSTAPGERKAFTLRDGSKVTLDADSALNVEFTPNQRSLRLTRGEAFFQVAKDPARPFVVNVSGTQVRAIGTEFDVRIADSRTVVAVVEGTVQLTAPLADSAPAPVQLADSTIHRDGFGEVDKSQATSAVNETITRITAGQAVAYGEDKGVERLSNADSSVATTWIGGRRQYRNEPLKAVLADMDRYTGRHIEVADVATGELLFTGTLELDNSEAWLKALAIALPVTITQKTNGVLLVSLNNPHVT